MGEETGKGGEGAILVLWVRIGGKRVPREVDKWKER